MPWWNPSTSNSSAKVKTALFPTAVFAILCLIVIYSEYLINAQSRQAQAIAVFALASDEESTETEIQVDEVIDEALLQLVPFAKSIVITDSEYSPLLNSFFEQNQLTQSQQFVLMAQVAKELYSEKNFQRSEALLNLIPIEQRVPLGVQFTLAQAQSQQKKLEQAIETYHQLVFRQPANQAATINYGLLLNKTRQYEKSIAVFIKSISISSGKIKAKAYAGLGTAKFELNQYDEAEQAFSKSIEYRPQHAVSWRKLARIQSFTSAAPSVVNQTYLKALSLSDLDFRAQLEYGQFLLSRLDFKTATTHLLKARKLAKSNSKVRLNLAMSYLERNKYKDARKHLRWILKRKKQTANFDIATILYNYSKKDYPKAIELFSTIELKDEYKSIAEYYSARTLSALSSLNESKKVKQPEYILAFQSQMIDNQWKYLSELRLSRIYQKNKQYKLSLNLIDHLVEETLNRESLLYQKSELLTLIGEHANALTAIENAYSASPNSPRVSIRYANILFNNNKSNEATELLNLLLEKKPQNIKARAALAKIQIALGQTELAIEQYLIATKSAPGNVRLKFELANIFVSNKDYLNAKETLSELLLQNSKHIEARILLARANYLNLEYQQSLIEIDFALKLNPKNEIALTLKNSIMEKL